ncbi:SDR family NAD(P)-dependent oxidoreductase [Saccharibacillus alkalitolerans]|uniref:SDR family NAD(P)-dependent oxidoreductase n=1 Tax=Saccharibacillus alkalitolerans TaxID=2705290 RepID=A0ABX0FA19_9BACL|nr:SDR family NAD(P)-dependent oxidoreductase [Saccharibacillus alkalitolerans]NGZ77270.1 SDR family NAD(P)-dependent oxidoreductase [Saccharibacillus alkalitolerans]
MQKQTVFITGANKGIGYETARQLGKQGYFVLLGARGEDSGREAVERLREEGVEAEHIRIDVASPSAIAAAAEQIASLTPSLDVLINNAGIGAGGNVPSEQNIEDVRRVYEVNVFGPIQIIQALLPLLKKAPLGRIVNVSSGLGSLTFNSDPNHEHYGANPLDYNSSKTALNAVTVLFAKEFAGTPLKINAVDPGYTATDLNGHSGTRTVSHSAGTVAKLALIGEDGPSGRFFDENGEIPW